MLRLVFTICMIDAPDMCEQRELLVHDRMPAMACVMGAMPELATWRQTHPNWRITRWTCEDDRKAKDGGSLPPGPEHAAAVPFHPTEPGAVPVAISR